MSEPKSRSLLFLLLPTVAVGVVFGLGLWGGRYLASIPFRQHIGHWDRAANLGALADSNGDRGIRAAAYEDPAAAERDMDRYTWVPSNTPMPFLGSIPAPGRHGDTSIDPLLVRSTRAIEAHKADGTVRVILTGGSTAFSSGAPREDATIGAFLEQVLAKEGHKVEVLTLANPAWCSTHERIAIENLISELEPDLVISLNGANDLHWGVQGRDTFAFRAYWEDSYFKIVSSAYGLAGRTPPPDPTRVTDAPLSCERIADRYVKNLRLAAFALSQRNTPYLVALQPTLLSSDKPLSDREQKIKASVPEDRRSYFERCSATLFDTATAATLPGVKLLDLRSVFHDDRREIFLDSYHFGDRGNLVVATALAAGVRVLLPALAAAEAP